MRSSAAKPERSPSSRLLSLTVLIVPYNLMIGEVYGIYSLHIGATVDRLD